MVEMKPGCQWPNSLTRPWEPGHNNYCCPPESLILPLLNVIQQQNETATLVIPDYPAKWLPTLVGMELERLQLPLVELAFAPGPSEKVEPWKTVGRGLRRNYVAVRVTAI